MAVMLALSDHSANIAFDAGGRSLNETDGTHTVIIVKCLYTRKEKLNTLSLILLVLFFPFP